MRIKNPSFLFLALSDATRECIDSTPLHSPLPFLPKSLSISRSPIFFYISLDFTLSFSLFQEDGSIRTPMTDTMESCADNNSNKTRSDETCSDRVFTEETNCTSPYPEMACKVAARSSTRKADGIPSIGGYAKAESVLLSKGDCGIYLSPVVLKLYNTSNP